MIDYTPEAYILKLARSFPSFHRYPAPWDIDEFMRPLGNMSTGERHTALFIANVWNPTHAIIKGWRFDAIDALTTWDAAHREAFIHWCQSPHLP